MTNKSFESVVLKSILSVELSLGNEIVEESSWPPKCEKLIILKNRFHQIYETKALEYSEINDLHYWFAEYSTSDSMECLACK